METWKVYRIAGKETFHSPAVYQLFSTEQPLKDGVTLVKSKFIAKFSLDTEDTWSWVLILDRNGLLKTKIQEDIGKIVSVLDLRGIQQFAVFHAEHDVSGTFVSEYASFYLTHSTIDEFPDKENDIFAFCPACGQIQRRKDKYKCRFDHLQRLSLLLPAYLKFSNQKIPKQSPGNSAEHFKMEKIFGDNPVVRWETIKTAYSDRSFEEAKEIVELLQEDYYPGYSFDSDDQKQVDEDERSWNEYIGSELPEIKKLEKGRNYHLIVRSSYVGWPDYHAGTLYDLIITATTRNEVKIMEVLKDDSILLVGDIVELHFEGDRWYFYPQNDGGRLNCSGGGHVLLSEA